MDQVEINARKDPNYCPYCLRCSGLVRMQKIGELHWKCTCGAEHMVVTQHDNIKEQAKLSS
jgi:hypothetical protein